MQNIHHLVELLQDSKINNKNLHNALQAVATCKLLKADDYNQTQNMRHFYRT